MAIFGKQGLQAGALYLAVMWATYGQKKAGFTSAAEVNAIIELSERKALASKSLKGKEYKAAAQEIRARRFAEVIARGVKRTGATGEERYKELETGEFKTAYEKLGYLR